MQVILYNWLLGVHFHSMIYIYNRYMYVNEESLGTNSIHVCIFYVHTRTIVMYIHTLIRWGK